MDYIQEELLRQRSALAGLLLGRTPDRSGTAEGASPAPAAGGGILAAGETAEAAAASAAEPPSERPVFPAGDPAVSSSGRRVPPDRDGGDRRREAGAGDIWEAAAGPLRRNADTSPAGGAGDRTENTRPNAARLGSSQAGAEETVSPAPPPPLRQSAGSTVREYAVTEFQHGGGGGVSDPYSSSGWTLPVEFRYAESRGAPGPEALSRAFQRDARRYDGGFSLY